MKITYFPLKALKNWLKKKKEGVAETIPIWPADGQATSVAYGGDLSTLTRQKKIYI
jgi:hypothetical protein